MRPSLHRPSALIHHPRLPVAAFLAGLLIGCGGSDLAAPRPSLTAGNGPNGNNGGVRITPAADTLMALGRTVQLTTNVAVIWSTPTPTVTTVDASGLVTAVGPGLGLIQALAKNHKADTAEVWVRQVAATVQVVPGLLTFTEFGIDTLSVVAADSNGYPIAAPLVTWTSDNTAVATVADGIVTPIADGTTTIRATADQTTGTAEVNVDIPMPYP